MKQTFEVRGGPQAGRTNLPLLRAELKAQSLDGFYVPHEDEYQNEYLPAAHERLAWVSGFTGSAGSAFVFLDDAVLFTDGRYTLQSTDQVDEALFSLEGIPEPGPFGWLSGQSRPGQTIGYDPKLISPDDLARLETAAHKAGAKLRAASANPIDMAWIDQPEAPAARIVPHALRVAGKPSNDKRADIAKQISALGADGVVLTAPASLAWLFNIRGGDVACTPLPLGRAILYTDTTADLFIDPVKTDGALSAHLGKGVTLRPLDELEPALGALSGRRICLDPATASAWFFSALEEAGAQIIATQDPCTLPKACKNDVEIAATQAAHIRDGAALTAFLHWLDTEAQYGNTSEIDAVIKLEQLREATGHLDDLSFETISGAGPNGAIVHYRVSSATNRLLEPGSLFLVDSGGQYIDGTTDVTRTVAIGSPSQEMCRHYTLVLKGHIALADVRFPPGTTGTHLDILARHALWQGGLDYAHGTGHGVGVYLGVHEGPQRIARAWSATSLQPGMIVSNEPGYYKTGAYGIRIENLQFVTPAEPIEGGEIDMLGFETLTYAPLARKLIQTERLTDHERRWVDNYHQAVRDKISPHIKERDTRDWLAAACKPL